MSSYHQSHDTNSGIIGEFNSVPSSNSQGELKPESYVGYTINSGSSASFVSHGRILFLFLGIFAPFT